MMLLTPTVLFELLKIIVHKIEDTNMRTKEIQGHIKKLLKLTHNMTYERFMKLNNPSNKKVH
jgi:hypothetical protein